MYFNLWSGNEYISKIIILIIGILITAYFIVKIIINFSNKIKKNKLEKEKINKIIHLSNEIKNEKEKLIFLKNNLNLDSTYKISNFLKLDYNTIQNYIKNNEIEKINNLIIKKIKGEIL